MTTLRDDDERTFVRTMLTGAALTGLLANPDRYTKQACDEDKLIPADAVKLADLTMALLYPLDSRIQED